MIPRVDPALKAFVALSCVSLAAYLGVSGAVREFAAAAFALLTRAMTVGL